MVPYTCLSVLFFIFRKQSDAVNYLLCYMCKPMMADTSSWAAVQKSHTTCWGITFEFTSQPLEKYVLYKMNINSMNRIWRYYIRQVVIIRAWAIYRFADFIGWYEPIAKVSILENLLPICHWDYCFFKNVFHRTYYRQND